MKILWGGCGCHYFHYNYYYDYNYNISLASLPPQSYYLHYGFSIAVTIGMPNLRGNVGKKIADLRGSLYVWFAMHCIVSLWIGCFW